MDHHLEPGWKLSSEEKLEGCVSFEYLSEGPCQRPDYTADRDEEQEKKFDSNIHQKSQEATILIKIFELGGCPIVNLLKQRLCLSVDYPLDPCKDKGVLGHLVVELLELGDQCKYQAD
jgi:hypothetical protein